MLDLFIKNGVVVSHQGLVRAGLGVHNGKIVSISGDEQPSQEVVDAQGLYVLPGVIDPHVHLGFGATRGQGETTFESDFKGESLSAAVGGVTTIITSAVFGHSTDPVLPRMKRAKDIASQNSIVDFKIFPYFFTKQQVEEIPELSAEGITNFKFPLAYIGQGHWRRPGMGVDWSLLYRGLEMVSQCGPPALAMIHAEEPTVIDLLEERTKSRGKTLLSAWTEARPSACEAMHVFAAGVLARELNSRLYIVHISAKESVDAIQYFRSQGVSIFGETCPHYLILTKDTVHAIPDVLAKVNPPLRGEADCRRLWKALNEGAITTIGTDHCTHRRNSKEGGIWQAETGFGSMGVGLAILLSEGVNKGRMTWELLAKVTSENVAREFGIYPQKGVLAPGSDADMVLVNPHQEWVITNDALYTVCDFSIYEGMKVKGRAVKTYVRGRLVAEDGHPVNSSLRGSYVYG